MQNTAAILLLPRSLCTKTPTLLVFFLLSNEQDCNKSDTSARELEQGENRKGPRHRVSLGLGRGCVGVQTFESVRAKKTSRSTAQTPPFDFRTLETTTAHGVSRANRSVGIFPRCTHGHFFHCWRNPAERSTSLSTPPRLFRFFRTNGEEAHVCSVCARLILNTQSISVCALAAAARYDYREQWNSVFANRSLAD